MHSARYQLMFEGQLLDGFEFADARKAAELALGLKQDQLDAMFSGKRVVLKKNLTQLGAKTYQSEVRSAGLICFVEPMGDELAVPVAEVSEPTERDDDFTDVHTDDSWQDDDDDVALHFSADIEAVIDVNQDDDTEHHKSIDEHDLVVVSEGIATTNEPFIIDEVDTEFHFSDREAVPKSSCIKESAQSQNKRQLSVNWFTALLSWVFIFTPLASIVVDNICRVRMSFEVYRLELLIATGIIAAVVALIALLFRPKNLPIVEPSQPLPNHWFQRVVWQHIGVWLVALMLLCGVPVVKWGIDLWVAPQAQWPQLLALSVSAMSTIIITGLYQLYKNGINNRDTFKQRWSEYKADTLLIRIGRTRFLATLWLLAVVTLTTAIAIGCWAPFGYNAALWLMLAIWCITVLVVNVLRRQRDMDNDDKKMRWLLIVPVVNLYFIVRLSTIPGSDGHNRFGPAPKAAGTIARFFGQWLSTLFIIALFTYGWVFRLEMVELIKRAAS